MAGAGARVRSYADAVAWLQGLEVASGWDLKLERVRAALDARGHPEAAYPAIHVAGTNGKGSTAAMLEAMLRAGGRRTGLYTSPHLVDFAERVRAGGRTIPHDAVAALVGELRAAFAARHIALTHFEFTTVLALEWFARIGVEIAVVEVGLGGRLDATNTVRPAVTVVTSIARDHEEWLGAELRLIAAEKAGIAKAGVAMVVGRLPAEADAVIAERAAAVGAPLRRAGHDGILDGSCFRGPGGIVWDGLAIGLDGEFQRANAEVALLALAELAPREPLEPAAVRDGLAGVRWPGRLAVVGRRPLVIVDGAHNPAGAAALARELPRAAEGRPIVLVFAVMSDKAWPAMLEHLAPGASEVILTRVGRRGVDPDVLAAAIGRSSVRVVPEPRAAVRAAVARAGSAGAVLVAGSIFLAGEAYAVVAPDVPLFEPWNGWGKGC